MADTTFNVYFPGNESDEGTANAPKQEGEINAENPTAPKTSNGSIRQIAGVNMTMNLAKKSVTYVTGNIGEWTGDSQLQSQIDSAKKIGGIGTMFLINPVAGAINLAYDTTISIINSEYKRKREKQRVAYAFGQTGMARNY